MFGSTFHHGIVVPDLGAARAELTESLGLEWMPDVRIQLQVSLHGQVVERWVDVSYSIGGLPYVELIKASQPPWGPDAIGLHHIGCWSDDIAADRGRMERAGGVTEAWRVDAAGELFGFVYVRLPSGVRIELVDSARKPAIAPWVANLALHEHR